MRYEAFISYSHRDKAWARWLQNALERYRLPKALRDQNGRDGGKRLRPFFRDDTELASSEDLTAAITQAMEQSAALIVICSPHAAASRWTNREIRAFRKIAPDRPILPLIVEGGPERDAPDCAFPEAMLFDDAGNPRPEPLAADLRPGADGKRGAQLKLIAGLLGVGVDALRQRDQQRRMRVMGAATAGAMAVSVVTITLAILAVQARNEADVRRGQAESLIDFMLVDLRDRLQPIGRLDVLDAVGDEASEYFNALGDRGTDEELLKRALALRQLGEVEFARRDFPAALQAFEDSRELTAALLARHPDNAEYLFEQSQAEFWVGYVAWQNDDLDGAELSFQRYHDHSQRLLANEPSNEDYKLEMVFALTNLGALARARGDREAALQFIQSANRLNEELLAKNPGDDTLREELAQGYSWEGSARRDLGDLSEADHALARSEELFRSRWNSREDMRSGERLAYLLGIRADLQWNLGDVDKAHDMVSECQSIFDELVTHDPSNDSWAHANQRCRVWVAEAKFYMGQVEASRQVLDDVYQRLSNDGPASKQGAELNALLTQTVCLQSQMDFRLSSGADAIGRAESCVQHRQALMDASDQYTANVDFALALGSLGAVLAARGFDDESRRAWQRALDELDVEQMHTPKSRAVLATLLSRMGDSEGAQVHWLYLEEIGFSDPRYRPTFDELARN
ncbi:toll/interleukin-1 receptor domain-containing protein [Marinihelvus fidelis]|uniref:Toll/interleukin-1 receptor domain-containing protein n=1 Tax=Marinihelvus fidelis TaxID=2613842 RepID=A0A5N0TGL6_9GAMM|nr:TIR domain-containing protein [Marinihelvus fidelis]KAA9134202.1 toll/interleukin-1 receptor domain-containing protein [Marinihelvus fidelis]